ncbi:uncharacterized protein EAF01_009126 [Botrytis porri]|uniref:uncharacterized protein n=1 Tax=Botrytis porri TaxID=87229 RepID=UPI00190143E0|nr:uncharacterized protein EAF01_009126 [Botrytis porri]KAF7896723.1 hypothetical protein EAF01_009126 [Botrytis porri]
MILLCISEAILKDTDHPQTPTASEFQHNHLGPFRTGKLHPTYKPSRSRPPILHHSITESLGHNPGLASSGVRYQEGKLKDLMMTYSFGSISETYASN